MAFGHYRVRSAKASNFPVMGGEQFLDYTTAGNASKRSGFEGLHTLVAVNNGSYDLLLGWEIFKLGPFLVPLPDYWALKLEGPVDEVVPVLARSASVKRNYSFE